VLECLQKSLRIASSCIDELTSVQLYVDALDRYIYYFEQGVEAVTPKYINSLVELITSNIDSVHTSEVHPQSVGAPGLVDGVNSPDMIVKVCCWILRSGMRADEQHFRNTLTYIQTRQRQHADRDAGDGDDEADKEGVKKVDWESVDVVGGCLKMGISR